jgi:hypothetical protein
MRKVKMKLVSHLTTKLLGAALALSLASVLVPVSRAQDQTQTPTTTTPATTAETADSGTSTDLYIMLGSDFDRPGLLPKANYNIGIGHTFGFLKKDPIGDELTFAYTYEDEGGHRLHVGSSGYYKPHGLSPCRESLLQR